jgi:hypothetical protein
LIPNQDAIVVTIRQEQTFSVGGYVPWVMKKKGATGVIKINPREHSVGLLPSLEKSCRISLCNAIGGFEFLNGDGWRTLEEETSQNRNHECSDV